MKIKTKLKQLQRIAPKHSRHGQLYRNAEATRRAYKRVNMWTLYVSDENEHMLRRHVFAKKRAMSPTEWHAWFAEHLDKIQREAILPALAVRTDLSKQWAVKQYIGWIGNAQYATRIAAARSARNPTKSQRGKNG